VNVFLAALLGLIGTVLGGGGGLYALLTVRAARRRIVAQADETVAGAARVLIGGAADLVEPLKRELGEVRADLRQVRRDADALDRQLRRLIAMIHDPYMTIDRLRVMVGEPGTN